MEALSLIVILLATIAPVLVAFVRHSTLSALRGQTRQLWSAIAALRENRYHALSVLLAGRLAGEPTEAALVEDLNRRIAAGAPESGASTLAGLRETEIALRETVGRFESVVTEYRRKRGRFPGPLVASLFSLPEIHPANVPFIDFVD